LAGSYFNLIGNWAAYWSMMISWPTCITPSITETDTRQWQWHPCGWFSLLPAGNTSKSYDGDSGLDGVGGAESTRRAALWSSYCVFC
jgi:hypothetical protein